VCVCVFEREESVCKFVCLRESFKSERTCPHNINWFTDRLFATEQTDFLYSSLTLFPPYTLSLLHTHTHTWG